MRKTVNSKDFQAQTDKQGESVEDVDKEVAKFLVLFILILTGIVAGLFF